MFAKSPDVPSLSRRDFLKLSSLSVLTLLLMSPANSSQIIDGGQQMRDEINTGFDWETGSYLDVDFVSNPSLLVDNPSAEKRMTRDLEGLTGDVSEFLNRLAIKYDDNLFGIDSESYKVNAHKFMTEVIKNAGLLSWAKSQGYTHTLPELQYIYENQSSFLRSLLVFRELHAGDTPNQFDEFMQNVSFFDKLDEVLKSENPTINTITPQLDRPTILSPWTYSWQSLIRDDYSPNRIYQSYYEYGAHPDTQSGRVFSEVTDLTKDVLPRHFLKELDLIEVDGIMRPKDYIKMNINQEVAPLIDETLKQYGLERTFASISMYDAGYPEAIIFPDTGKMDFGVEYDMTAADYRKHRRAYNHILLHESFHSLEGRAWSETDQGLSDKDYINFRELQQQLVMRFDPLSSMKNIFNPDGEYVDSDIYTMEPSDTLVDLITQSYDKINYMFLTDYYHIYLEGAKDAEGRSLRLLSTEFRAGMSIVGDFDFDEHLLVHESHDDISGILVELGSYVDSMDSFSKLIATTIINNADHIVAKKRIAFKGSRTDSDYFMHKVIPYTLTHLALYREKELLSSIPLNVQNRDLLINYVSSWQKEVDRFVRHGLPNRELAADLFAEALLDDSSDIEWGESRKIAQQMVELLKKNGLAKEDGITTIG